MLSLGKLVMVRPGEPSSGCSQILSPRFLRITYAIDFPIGAKPQRSIG